ncbi:hypothetical protein BKI52_42715 [marine bacterium AO1-C]|nr:hypothetical protein BKI52_42715 [marine bacterium AO1-C]
MKNLLILSLLILGCFSGYAQLPQWNQAKKDRLTKMCEQQLTKVLLVYQNGKLVFEYGDQKQDYNIFSMRKSMVSLLYGIYANEGKINLNANLKKLGIDDFNKLTEQEKEATIMDLLKAKSGVYHQAAYETPGMMKNRPKRGSHKPGTHWFYNNWDFNALTTIFEKTTGKTVFAAFKEKIADPLKFQDYDIKKQSYIREAGVSMHEATIWRLSGRDLLKLGINLLNQGKQDNKVVIPVQWIDRSTKVYSELGILGGYGLCWWVASRGEHYPFVKFPDRSFSARGTGEQSLVVVPARNMVIVHLTEVNSPKDKMMHVVTFGRMLKLVMKP